MSLELGSRKAPPPSSFKDQLQLFALFIATLLLCVAGPLIRMALVQNILALATVAAIFVGGYQIPARFKDLFLICACIEYYLAFGGLSDPSFFVFVSIGTLLALPPLVIDFLARVIKRKHRIIAGLKRGFLFIPPALMLIGIVLAHVSQDSPAEETSSLTANILGTIYCLYYAVFLFFIGLGCIEQANASASAEPNTNPGEVAGQGQFEAAAQLYEKQGRLEEGAEMAQRAGEWMHAAELYRQMGNFFMAGEMYYRAESFEEALLMYEQSGTVSAAAELCVRLGKCEKAAELLVKSGNHKQAVEVLEAAGMKPPAQLYEKARFFEKAVIRYQEQGNPLRAAEIMEDELGKAYEAACLYKEAGMFQRAGELFEHAKKIDEAIDAYLGSANSVLQAARLCFESGDNSRARQILAEHSGNDAQALLMLAKILWQENQIDDSVRTLQQVKKLGGATGTVSYLLGRCYLTKGLPELAEPELRMAKNLPLDPEETLDATYHLGRVLEMSNRREEALELYQSVLAKDLYFKDTEARYRALKAGSPVPM
jgi:tetratricopeptide (TPR) repeat protein